MKQSFQFLTDDDLSLMVDRWQHPDADTPWVVLSHGGGQTRHSWQETGDMLARSGWNVLAYDHRGHGESGWSADGSYPLPRFAKDQQQLVNSLPGKPVLVGASLGGLSALLAEGESPENHYRAIILVDITPQMNQQGALQILEFMESSLSEGFASLDEVADVIAGYTGRSKRINPEGLRKNLRLCDDGKYRWHWDPAFLTIRDDYDTSPQRLIDAARNIDLPMLLVRGRESDVVTEDVAKEFLELVPHCEYVDIKDARHMVAGDRNTVFSEEILKFLQRL